jgi:bis(5'-nucleosyl)-tetraphosphatase (symmetrical)
MNYNRYIFIGDPHGCLDELQKLLYQVDYDRNYDRVIVLGDLIDRGPDSAGVVHLVREMNLECLRGNHEDKHIRYGRHWNKFQADSRYKIPMKMDMEKLKVFASLSNEDLVWLDQLPTFIEVPELNLVAVHAGCLPRGDVSNQAPQCHMYTRYIHKDSHKQLHMGPNFSQPVDSVEWSDVYSGKVNVIYGHQVNSLTDILVKTNSSGMRTIGIDTGCCFGGRLTAFCFDINQNKEYIVQVQAQRQYSSIPHNGPE